MVAHSRSRQVGAGCEKEAVRGPADGVGDRLFSELRIKVSQVAGSALLQEEENKTAIKGMWGTKVVICSWAAY